MPRRGLAPLDLHELVEFQHARLAAAIALAALVKDGGARVVDALLVVGPRLAPFVGGAAGLPPAGLAVGDLEGRVIVLALRWGRRRGGRGLCSDGGACGYFGELGGECLLGGRQVGVRRYGLLFDFWGQIGGAMLPLGAGLDLEEFVEGKDPGFAAFPACYAATKTKVRLQLFT